MEPIDYFSAELDNESIVNFDGRVQWKCEWCGKRHHPDTEPTQSIYYHSTSSAGPFFCNIHCRADYRNVHDEARFVTEEELTQMFRDRKTREHARDIASTRKKWNVENFGKTRRQRAQVAEAIRVATTTTNDDTSQDPSN